MVLNLAVTTAWIFTLSVLCLDASKLLKKRSCSNAVLYFLDKLAMFFMSVSELIRLGLGEKHSKID